MVFEYAYGAFGGVAAVCVRWDELVVDVVAAEVLFKNGGGFVV